LDTMRRAFASEILTPLSRWVWKAIGIFAFPSLSPSWVNLQQFF
jgi:hypothetical protein